MALKFMIPGLALNLLAVTGCSKPDEEEETYTFPMEAGNSWTYLHKTTFTGDKGETSRVDTVKWEAKDSIDLFGAQCAAVASSDSRDQWKTQIMSAYRHREKEGLFLVGIDSGFAGESLLKSSASRYLPENLRIIAERVSKDTVWDAVDLGGSKVQKRLTRLQAPLKGFEVTTWQGDSLSIREIFTDSGLSGRYHRKVTISDSVGGNKYSIIDSLILIKAVLKTN